jgi:transposase
VGDHVGASPVDRGKPGSKLHLVGEGHGLPLTAAVTAANVPDVVMFTAMVDDIPPVRTGSGRRRHRPGKLDADKGYDSRANRAWLRRRGITARIARRGIESSTRLGRYRWRVERALSWLSCWRRLQVRWDRGSERWLRLCCWPARSPVSSGSDTQQEQLLRLARALRGVGEDEAVAPLVAVWIVLEPGAAMPR